MRIRRLSTLAFTACLCPGSSRGIEMASHDLAGLVLRSKAVAYAAERRRWAYEAVSLSVSGSGPGL